MMEGMTPGSGQTYSYRSIAAFQNALRNAYWVRKHHPRADGARYDISNNAATGTITIRVLP